MAVVSRAPWQRLPAELVPVLRPRIENTVQSVVDEITTSVFAESGNPKVERDIERGVRVAVERFADLIGTADPALPPGVRETFVELGAAEAREERTPETLLAALRIAARVLLRTTTEALAAARPPTTNDVIDLSDAITTYVDELAAASTDGFTLQHAERAGESDRRRRLLAELLLRGNASERDVITASRDIGWRSIDTVVPVLVSPEHIRDARFHYRQDAVVTEREHNSIIMLPNGPVASRPQLTQALHGKGAVVGPTVNWTRVPEAVRLTEVTASDPNWLPVPDPVFVVDHLAALALRGEHSAFTILSERRLAPFADLREATRNRLLETLHSWLRHWGSRTEVAAELHVHPQTVSYRIRQLRDMLGADLDSPTTRFELLLVLSDRTART